VSPLHVASRSFSGRSPPSIQTLYLRHWWIETCIRLVWLSYSIHSVQAHCSYSESHTSNRYSKHVEALLKTHSCVFSHSIKRRGLPLSAVSVSLHHTPGCLRSTDTCDRTPSAMFEGNFWRFVDVSLLRNEDQPQKKTLTSFATCSAGKRAGTSALQAPHCTKPEQWTWLLCSLSVIPDNKLPLQELHQ